MKDCSDLAQKTFDESKPIRTDDAEESESDDDNDDADVSSKRSRRSHWRWRVTLVDLPMMTKDDQEKVNDDLLYDPDEEHDDEKWMDKERLR